MFEAAGWHTITVKYGRRLRGAVRRATAAAALRDAHRRDDQRGVPAAAALRRRPSCASGCRAGRGSRDARAADRRARRRRAARARSATSAATTSATCSTRSPRPTRSTDRPSVVFAYTIKAWRLPTEGHPANHSALLSTEQWEQLAADARRRRRRPVGGVPGRLAGGRAVPRERRSGCAREPTPLRRRAADPADVGRAHAGSASTQQAFGRFFVDLAHAAPEVAARVVTVSPDVASSTNLGGWINRVGIWHLGDRIDWFADDTDTLVRWRESEHGQHIELGIAEGNLVGLLAELGATWSRDGEPLLPIGTLYDPFVNRALEPWSFGMYAGGAVDPRRHAVGRHARARRAARTSRSRRRRSGSSSRAASRGSRRSARTSNGRCSTRSARLGRPDGTSAYFRLTTRPIDQALAAVPEDAEAREQRRRARRSPAATVLRAAAGRARGHARRDGRDHARGRSRPPTSWTRPRSPCDVVCLTSADLVFRALQARQRPRPGERRDPRRAVPGRRARRRSSPCSTATRTRSASSPAIRCVPDRLPRRRRLRPVRRRRRPLPLLRHRRRDDRRRRARPALTRTGGEHGLVVLPGVDVERHGTGHGDVDDLVRPAVEQLPDALVAVQVARARGTCCGRTRAGGRGRRRIGTRRAAASPRPARSAATVAGVTPGWSPSSSTSTSQRGSIAPSASGDRGRAAGAEVVVLDDLGPGQVDGLADRGGRAADHADELVERARAGGRERVVEQRRPAVREQLLGLAEPPRPAGGEHEAGDPAGQRAATSRRAARRSARGSPRSRSRSARRPGRGGPTRRWPRPPCRRRDRSPSRRARPSRPARRAAGGRSARRRSRRGSRSRRPWAPARRCRARPACAAGPQRVGDVERLAHGRAALGAGDEPDVADAGLERAHERASPRRCRARRRSSPRPTRAARRRRRRRARRRTRRPARRARRRGRSACRR